MTIEIVNRAKEYLAKIHELNCKVVRLLDNATAGFELLGRQELWELIQSLPESYHKAELLKYYAHSFVIDSVKLEVDGPVSS